MTNELRAQITTYMILKHGSMNNAFHYYEENDIWYELTADEYITIMDGSYTESLRESGFEVLAGI